jgi:hypothetical protein
MSSEETLSKIRSIRSLENPSLKTSSYIKNTFADGSPIKLRDYQVIGIMNMCMMPKLLLGDDTGLGKAQPIYSKVLTSCGWKEIGNIKKGDYVYGSKGKLTKVMGVFPQGKKPVFKVTFSDGASTECCEEHLWTVRTHNSRRSGDGWHVKSLKEIAISGLKRQRNGNGIKYYIPMAEAIEHENSQLPIDPYILGVILGDGSITRNIYLCNGDPELFSIFESKMPDGCRLGNYNTRDRYTRPVLGNVDGLNPLKSGLKILNLMGTNWDTKFIPEIYLRASKEQRINLLRGLMDTDGYISKDGNVTQFYSSNPGLVNNFVELIQSLGGIATVKSKIPQLSRKSKAKKAILAYTVAISLPNDVIPFSLSRKLNRWKPRTKYLPVRGISKIEPVGLEECVCIRVDADDSLYVTDNYIVTHNTLQVLSTIGYVWEKEPEYVPIILTTKSALFQWESECRKFMTGMQPVVVHGEPHERESIYNEFFKPQDNKKLLLMTYDTLFRDLDAAVVKDKSFKASPDDKKALKKAREEEKVTRQKYEVLAASLNEISDSRTFEISEYISSRLSGMKGDSPPGWDADAESSLKEALDVKKQLSHLQNEVIRLSDLVSPPLRTSGISEHIENFKLANPGAKFLLAMDEAHKVKNYRSQVHEKVKALSSQCDRIIGMTATPVKNRLMEFFGIFRIINPALFPKVMAFQNDYCVTKLQRVPGGRQVPIIVGYKNLDRFVDKVEPYYLSRKKHDVAKELPELISMEVPCELYDLQDELYDMAENGVKDVTDEDDSSDILSSLVMCQQSVDAPQLILDENGEPFDGPSAKIDRLIEFLEEDASGQKVIIFSRFEKMVSQIEKHLIKSKINYVRITGKETNPKVRQESREKFQDPNSGINVIMITMAGSESLNLQAAEHFIFIDMPWSFGDHQQLIGRMMRIGSSHKTVVAHYYIGIRKDGSKTIDHHVLSALQSKKKLSDKVTGASAKGTLDLVKSDSDDFMKSVFSAVKNHSPIPEVKKSLKPKKKSIVMKESNDSAVNVKDPEIESISIDLSDI